MGLAQAKGQNFPIERPKVLTLLYTTIATWRELEPVLVVVNRH
jgi:hypothetical protein